ncbi:hypothetical protein MXB_4466 [Myxobolus squamalis]|nr:hypothetical protein MXB_4466 [Myxobolus squamalis]
MPDLKFEWINFLNSLDFLDFTKNGVYIWNSKSVEYKSRNSKRDETYVEAMRLLLNDAMSDDEKIDIFIHFTHIYTKFPMIQSIHATQNALVDKIYKYMINEKENIIKDSLISTNSLNKVFPLGELGFQLMTVKKMTEKYSQYMYYTSCILGPNYSMMDIANKITIEARDWTCKNLSSVYLNILSKRHNNLKKNRGYLYKIASNILHSSNFLIVNYPEDLIKISFDEFTVKALSFYNDIFFVPHININKYKSYKIIEESLRNLNIVKNKLKNTNELNLLALYMDYAHIQLVSGLSYHWDSPFLAQYSLKLSEIIAILHEKVDDIFKNLG